MEKVNIDKFEEIVARAERFEEGFSKKMENLATSEQVFIKIRKEFALELEELRSARKAVETSLTKNIENTIKESINSALPKIMPRVIAEFNEKTQEGSEACLQKASRIVDSIDASIKKVARFNEEQKISMTWRRLGLNAAFCLSALLTAFGINYFWKTHINYNYELTPEIAQSFFFGEAAKEIYNDLTETQQKKFFNALNKKRREAIEGK